MPAPDGRIETRASAAARVTSGSARNLSGDCASTVTERTPGLLPSAVSVGAGLDVDSMDVKGALTFDAISEADLKAGRWDGAALALYLTDWSAPEIGRAHVRTPHTNEQ